MPSRPRDRTAQRPNAKGHGLRARDPGHHVHRDHVRTDASRGLHESLVLRRVEEGDEELAATQEPDFLPTPDLTTSFNPAGASGTILLSDGAELAGLDQGYGFALLNVAWAPANVVGATPCPPNACATQSPGSSCPIWGIWWRA